MLGGKHNKLAIFCFVNNSSLIVNILLLQVLFFILFDANANVNNGDEGEQMCGLSDQKNKRTRMSNWGGNFQFSTSNVQFPSTVEDVQEVVWSAPKLRILGSRHSFSHIADSNCILLSTQEMNQILSYNASVPSVTVEGGIYFKDLIENLDTTFALSNLAGLKSVSIAGAIQTGTHGSGNGNPSLASQVRSLELVTAEGNVVQIGPDDPRLKAIVVGLGAFGVITKMELNLVPTYTIQQYIYTNMTINNLLNNLDTIWELGYSVQLINQFSSPGMWTSLIINAHSNTPTPVLLGNELFGATLASNTTLSWSSGLLIENFGLETQYSGNHIQTEYMVPYQSAKNAIYAVTKFFEEGHPNYAKYKEQFIGLLVRTIKTDDHWMSEFRNVKENDGDKPVMVAIHFSWFNEGRWPQFKKEFLPLIENALLQFGAVPHWGKEFAMEPRNFLGHYTKLDDFIKLVEEFDPLGKFRNKFMDKNIFLSPYEDTATKLAVYAVKHAPENKNKIGQFVSNIALKIAQQHTYNLVFENKGKEWAVCSDEPSRIKISVKVGAKQSITSHAGLTLDKSIGNSDSKEYQFILRGNVRIEQGSTLLNQATIVIDDGNKKPEVSVISSGRACYSLKGGMRRIFK